MKIAIIETPALIRQALTLILKPLAQVVDDPNQADVLLVDTDGGLAALADRALAQPTIAFGCNAHSGFAARAILYGASAYLTTHALPTQIEDALAAVTRGERWLTPEIASLVQLGGPAGALTGREIQVMELLAAGSTCRQIAEQHQVSVKTVDTQRLHILRKLDLDNVADLARFAIRNGYLKP